MTDAMDALLQYAQEQLEPSLLLLEPEHRDARDRADKQEKHLRAMLSDEAEQCLDALMDERASIRFFEDEALFRAGFQIAMELSK